MIEDELPCHWWITPKDEFLDMVGLALLLRWGSEERVMNGHVISISIETFGLLCTVLNFYSIDVQFKGHCSFRESFFLVTTRREKAFSPLIVTNAETHIERNPV